MDVAFKISFPNAPYRELKEALERLIDKNLNSLRFCHLGENYKNKI